MGKVYYDDCGGEIGPYGSFMVSNAVGTDDDPNFTAAEDVDDDGAAAVGCKAVEKTGRPCLEVPSCPEWSETQTMELVERGTPTEATTTQVCYDDYGLHVQTQAAAANVITVFDTCNSPLYDNATIEFF